MKTKRMLTDTWTSRSILSLNKWSVFVSTKIHRENNASISMKRINKEEKNFIDKRRKSFVVQLLFSNWIEIDHDRSFSRDVQWFEFVLHWDLTNSRNFFFLDDRLSLMKIFRSHRFTFESKRHHSISTRRTNRKKN